MTLVHAGLPALDDPKRARKMAEVDALQKYSPTSPASPPAIAMAASGAAEAARSLRSS